MKNLATALAAIILLVFTGPTSAALILETSLTASGDSLSGGFGETLQVTGTVEQFNVTGATLLNYQVIGQVLLESAVTFDEGQETSASGVTFEPTISSVSYLGMVEPGYSRFESCSLGDLERGLGTCNYTDYQGIFFEAALSDLPNLIGDGVIDFVAEGLVANLEAFNAVNVVGTATLSIELSGRARYCIDGGSPGVGVDYVDGTCAEALPDYPVVGGGSGGVSVPEPTTLALMAIGLAGIGFARRKKA